MSDRIFVKKCEDCPFIGQEVPYCMHHAFDDDPRGNEWVTDLSCPPKWCPLRQDHVIVQLDLSLWNRFPETRP